MHLKLETRCRILLQLYCIVAMALRTQNNELLLINTGWVIAAAPSLNVTLSPHRPILSAVAVFCFCLPFHRVDGRYWAMKSIALWTTGSSIACHDISTICSPRTGRALTRQEDTQARGWEPAGNLRSRRSRAPAPDRPSVAISEATVIIMKFGRSGGV